MRVNDLWYLTNSNEKKNENIIIYYFPITYPIQKLVEERSTSTFDHIIFLKYCHIETKNGSSQ